MRKILQPADWARPKGYANGILAEGRFVFTAGMVGWNERQVFEQKGFLGQFEQALKNTVAVLNEGGAGPADIVRMTCYLTDKRPYLADPQAVGAIWREVLGRVYPCMTVVEVSALIEDEALVEIETIAVTQARS